MFVVSQASVEALHLPHQTGRFAFGAVPALGIIRERVAVEVQLDEASVGLGVSVGLAIGALLGEPAVARSMQV